MLGIVALSGLSIVGVACGGGVGSVAGGEPIPFEQLGQKIAEKLCPAIATCCSQNGFAKDHETCKNMATALQRNFAEQKDRHGLTYDPNAAGNCVAQIVAAYGTCSPRQAMGGVEIEACDSFLRGRKAAGERCEESEECAPGTTCSFGVSSGDSPPANRICIRTKRPAVGDACLSFENADKLDPSKTYAMCGFGDGFYCDPKTNTCKARGGAGTRCVDTTDSSSHFNGALCDDNSYCDYETKNCEPRVAAGGECKSGMECVPTARCDYEAKKCVALKAGGASCSKEDSSGECQYGCDAQSGKCRANVIGRDMCSGSDID